MNGVLRLAVALTALVFIAASAAMNALFLSSLGRTSTEAALLSSVSIAADVMKAVLPILLARALLLRAHVQTAIAGTMLCTVVMLSLTSGSGFIATMRGVAHAANTTLSDKLAAATRDLSETDTRLAGLPLARPTAVIEAELAAAAADRRWTASTSCTMPANARQFCSDVSKFRVDLAAAIERDALGLQRQKLRSAIAALTDAGAGRDDDPQAAALAGLLGIERTTLRATLSTGVAIVLELGSVVLLLLLFGPTLRNWREPLPAAKPVPPAAEVPAQPDRQFWQRAREKRIAGERSKHNDRR